MILNKDPNTFYHIWKIKDFNDFDYWHVDLQKELDLVDIIPKEIYEKILLGNVKLLLTCYKEGHTFLVDKLCDSKINPSNVTIISDNKKIIEKIKNVFSEQQKPEIYWSLIFELTTKIQSYMYYKQINEVHTLEKKKYNKSFLNFNRRWRIHRPSMVALLCAYNLMDKGYISLAAETDDNLNWDKVFNDVLKKLSKDIELSELIVNNKDQIINLPNLYLDTHNLAVNRPRLIEDDIPFDATKKLYEDTYFSLVSETFFFENDAVFFTEKIFKPIVYKHPFILISSPMQLDSLRELGYRTFHPYINEDYDKETDDVKRLKLIVQEVYRLSNLGQDELFEFIDNVKPIVKHNLHVLRSKPHYGHIHKLIG